jgi:hypothetical protein
MEGLCDELNLCELSRHIVDILKQRYSRAQLCGVSSTLRHLRLTAKLGLLRKFSYSALRHGTAFAKGWRRPVVGRLRGPCSQCAAIAGLRFWFSVVFRCKAGPDVIESLLQSG